MANTTLTASDYGIRPPRAVHVGVNYMHGQVIETMTNSASDELWLFPLPAQGCFVTECIYSGSLPAGVTGQTVIKLGTHESDNCIGTITISGGAATPKTRLTFAPVTISGTDVGYVPFIASVNSATTTATFSMSLYVMLKYVMPGNLN